MKIICDRAALVEAVTNVSRAISSKSNLSALEGVLIKPGNNSIILTGYNLEMGITTEIPARISESNDILLNARLFGEIIKKLPGETVNIETDESFNIIISSNGAEFSIIGNNPAEFPELPSVSGGNEFQIFSTVLKSMIRQTRFAIAIDDSKPVHKGILFETDGENLKLVAVDGFRLAVRKEKIDNFDKKISFIVPGKTLAEIEKLLPDDENEIAKIHMESKQIFFSIGGYHVISRLLEGNFIDYQSAIPPQSKITAIVDTRPLTECFERASLMIVERMKSPVKCIFEDLQIMVSCSTTLGKSFEVFPAQIEGEPIEIGFNNRFLLDALHACETDSVRLILNGPNSPMKMVPVEGDNFLFLVLPVRLRQEI